MRLSTKTLQFKSTLSHWAIAALVSIFMLSALVITGCSANLPAAANQLPQVNSIQATTGTAATLYDENAVVSLYERSIPAVVEIIKIVNRDPNASVPFGLPAPNESGQGSGFFIDADGNILTNFHVVENASSLTVTSYDGKSIEAKVVGTDPQNDIALIKVNTAGLGKVAYLPLGNSDLLKPGQMAIAIGSPHGLQGSITAGLISGIGRSLPTDSKRLIANVIQTDAAINPGNSGGPLLNSKGEVIGINTAMEAQANSIGFAVPINTAKARMPALLKGGQVKSPWLGIEGMAIGNELVSKLSLSVQKGVYVTNVTTGSPADKANIKGSGRSDDGSPKSSGDIITGVDNISVTKVEDMLNYFNGKQPGDTVSVTINREGKQQVISVVLGEWPEQVSPRIPRPTR
jgi:S1-C subfamily serine protease